MSTEKFSEFLKEIDNYTWFCFGCASAVLAAYVPQEMSAVLLVLAGVAIEKAKKA